jgi:hypothetical protein
MLYIDVNHTQRERDSFHVSHTYRPSSARVACLIASTTSSTNSNSNCIQIKELQLAYPNPFTKQQQQRRGNC